MECVRGAVEKYRELILDAECYIRKNPETGYKEFKTSAYMAEKFEALGYTLSYADGITGFYTVIDTGREGPEVLVLAELDSIICPEHPEANKETGAVHSCGHNAQCAALLGVAAALKDERILSSLSGRIRLCAVPAEELLEIGYRTRLMEEGKIKYFGGKCEFLRRGYFDGVDVALMVHTGRDFLIQKAANGCIAKRMIYKGVASHAGGAPENGINALYAATCGINAVNAIRETFHDEDHIRFHPIITHGGDMVNAIPERVVMESYVRGMTIDAMISQNQKVNRALVGAALSLGANLEIIDSPGYSPLYNDGGMMELAYETLGEALPEVERVYLPDGASKGSTDMGDLSCIMPVVHPYAAGACGKSHGNDYQICDPEAACVKSAVWQVAMVKRLLENGGARAKQICADFQPKFDSKEAFLAFQDSIQKSGDCITYTDSGAEVRW